MSIVLYNTPASELHTVTGCVARCLRVSRLLFVDHSPADTLRAEVETLRAAHPALRIDYISQENRGYGGGHNVAMRQTLADAGSDYHLVLNADVVWQGDVIGSMAEYMDAHPQVGIMGPRMYYPNGDLQLTCRLLPRPWEVLVKRFFPQSFSLGWIDRYVMAGHDHGCSINVPFMQGSFLLIRREALAKSGLFDERFFMYAEDIDLTRRFHKDWITLYYAPACVTHVHAAASRVSLRMTLVHMLNMARYFNKWGWIFDGTRKQINAAAEASATPVATRPRQRG